MSAQPSPCAAGPWIPGTDAIFIPTPYKDAVSGRPSSGVYLILVRGYEYPTTARIVEFRAESMWVVETFRTRSIVRLVDVAWFAKVRGPE